MKQDMTKIMMEKLNFAKECGLDVDFKKTRNEETHKTPCQLMQINTTIGVKFLITTPSRSREFKTLNGAERWAQKNNCKIVERKLFKE